MKKEFTARQLRKLLTAAVIILFIVGVGGFYLAYQALLTNGKEVSNEVANAKASNDLSTSLAALKVALASQQEIADVANNLYATADNWQSSANRDIKAYAALSDITISSISFNNATADPATEQSDPAATPATSGPTRSVVVEIESPVSYSGLLTFMTYIQHNTPKMQILSVELSRGVSRGDTIGVTALTIGVYTK